MLWCLHYYSIIRLFTMRYQSARQWLAVFWQTSSRVFCSTTMIRGIYWHTNFLLYNLPLKWKINAKRISESNEWILFVGVLSLKLRLTRRAETTYIEMLFAYAGISRISLCEIIIQLRTQYWFVLTHSKLYELA